MANELLRDGANAGAGCAGPVAGALLTLGLAAVLFDKLRSTFDPMWRDYDYDRLMRAQRYAEDTYQADLFAGWALRLVPVIALCVFLSGLAVVVLLILYRQLAAWQTLRARHMIALRKAEMMRFPEGLQTLAFHDSSRETAAPLLAPPAWGDEAGDAKAEQDAEGVPSFGQLLDGSKVGKGHPLLLGFDAETGAELPGAWLDLYATATAGLPGTGKTTSQRFFACQTALHGARFVVCDPHAGAGDDSLAATLEPLRNLYLCDPADTPKKILEAVRLVAATGEARISGRDKSTTPVILWVDELTSLLGRSDVGDPLAELLEKIAQEYRKRYVYLSASGQIWTASRTTSELRDSLASVLCHRMKRGQARLLLPTDEAAQVEHLRTGEAILYRTSGETTRVRIPNTTAGDVRRVAGLLTDTASVLGPEGFRFASAGDAPEGTRKASGSHTEAASVVTSSAPASAITLDASAARVIARLRGGATVPELVRELAGSTSGRKADEARAMVEQAIRTALGGE